MEKFSVNSQLFLGDGDLIKAEVNEARHKFFIRRKIHYFWTRKLSHSCNYFQSANNIVSELAAKCRLELKAPVNRIFVKIMISSKGVEKVLNRAKIEEQMVPKFFLR